MRIKNLGWCTDIHLDFVTPDAKLSFINRLNTAQCDAVMIGGDISGDGPLGNILSDLQFIDDHIKKPVYFVLGNHDYYGAFRSEARTKVRYAVSNGKNLIWLEESGPQFLNDDTALVGNGLWCDWRAGDIHRSNVWIRDYAAINDLAIVGNAYNTRLIEHTLHQWAADHVRQLIKDLKKAFESHSRAIVLTHVPPFHELSFAPPETGGGIQNNNWAPHFVCASAGHELKELMKECPDKRIEIFCGHTHGRGEGEILPNLTVKNGYARYKNPILDSIINV